MHHLDEEAIDNLGDLSEIDLEKIAADMNRDTPEVPTVDDLDILGGSREVVHPGDAGTSDADKVTRLQDRLMRVAADFDNFRKRARRESDEAALKASESLLRTLLPIIDNLERAVDTQNTQADPDATLNGVRMVMKQLNQELIRLQVVVVESLGTQFNPEVHEAFESVPAPTKAPGTILSEFQKGYLYRGRLLRPALVSVAAPEGAGDEKGVARPTQKADEETDPAPEQGEVEGSEELTNPEELFAEVDDAIENPALDEDGDGGDEIAPTEG